MSLPEAKLSGDHTETETLQSVLSHEDDSFADVAAGWHQQEGKQRSKDIDKYLNAESSKLKRQIKVLVLGMIEPKDLFWKQTWLLENPLTDHEREGMKSTIQSRVFDIARRVADELLEQLKTAEGEEILKQETTQMLQDVLAYEDENFGQKWNELYRDLGFHKRLENLCVSFRDTENKLLETQHSLFLDRSSNTSSPLEDLVQRVLSPEYNPTDHDYLHFDNRRKASYLREAQIQKDSHLLRILDLHAGTGERKKWIHFFEDTKCVIFVADLGVHGQSLMDHDESTMLHESLVLFDSVARSAWFKETPMICVLSNVAAFRGKLKDHPMSKYFPEYKGETEDDAVDFVVQRHWEATEDRKGIEVHVCDELSSNTVENILELMERTVLKSLLEELSIAGKNIS